MRHMPRVSLWSVLALVAALPGCHTSAEAQKFSRASPNDLLFITTLYNIVEFDRQVIPPEVARTSDPRVVALAQELMAQADSFNARVLPIATRDGITEPQLVTFSQQSDLHDRIAALMGSRNYDYDQEFLDDEIYAHREAIRRSKQMSADPTGDPELRSLAAEGLTLLQNNLSKLETLKSALLAEKN